MTIWSILRAFDIFYDHLVYFVVIWNISSRFGILDQEKSGNPDVYLNLGISQFGYVCIYVRYNGKLSPDKMSPDKMSPDKMSLVMKQTKCLPTKCLPTKMPPSQNVSFKNVS
jgi:hypothetical protein